MTENKTYQQIVDYMNAFLDRIAGDLPDVRGPEFQQLSKRKLQRLQDSIRKYKDLEIAFGGNLLAWTKELDGAVERRIREMDELDKPRLELYKRACEVGARFPSHLEEARKSPYFAWMQGTLNDIQAALDEWDKLANSEEAPPYGDPRVQAQAKVVVDLWSKYCPASSSDADAAAAAAAGPEKKRARTSIDDGDIDEDDDVCIVVKREKAADPPAAASAAEPKDEGGHDTENDDDAEDSEAAGSPPSSSAMKPVTTTAAAPQPAAAAKKKAASYPNQVWVDAWVAYRDSLVAEDDKSTKRTLNALIGCLHQRKKHRRSVRAERESIKEICVTYKISWDTISSIFKGTIVPGVISMHGEDGSSSE